jgi:hypothetical protein
MLRLNRAVEALLLLLATNCEPNPASRPVAKPSTLSELLQAHDAEVARHGKDLKYIQPIGRYGREGVLASIKPLSPKSVSSYIGIELVFGVAEEARISKGYDLCQDRETLDRLAATVNVADIPAYERTTYQDLLGSYCRQ